MKTCTASETCAHLAIDFAGFCADMETRRTWGPRCQGFAANTRRSGATVA